MGGAIPKNSFERWKKRLFEEIYSEELSSNLNNKKNEGLGLQRFYWKQNKEYKNDKNLRFSLGIMIHVPDVYSIRYKFFFSEKIIYHFKLRSRGHSSFFRCWMLWQELSKRNFIRISAFHSLIFISKFSYEFLFFDYEPRILFSLPKTPKDYKHFLDYSEFAHSYVWIMNIIPWFLFYDTK